MLKIEQLDANVSHDDQIADASEGPVTLVNIFLAGATPATRAGAHRAVAEFVDWYNRERRHSSLGDVSPAQYERQLGRVARAA